MKPVIAMILAGSVGGCLTGAEYFGRPADSPLPAAPAEPEPTSGPAKYDASWYRTEYWAGEYPSGFTVDNDTTLSIRVTPGGAEIAFVRAQERGDLSSVQQETGYRGPPEIRHVHPDQDVRAHGGVFI